MNKKTPLNIPQLIKAYAKVYRGFEKAQNETPFLTENSAGKDHKTSVIGEYYAYMYLYHQGLNPEYEGLRESWDITAKNKRSRRKYQVKTASYYAEFKQLPSIHKGWDILMVIQLNEFFEPEPERCWEIPVKEFEKHYKYGVAIRLNARSPLFIKYYKKYLLPPGWWKTGSTEGGTAK